MQPRAIKALIVGLAVVAIGALVVWKLRTPGDVREAAAPPMWTEQQFAEIDAQIAQGKLGAAHTKLVAALAHRAAHRAALRDEDRARLLLRLGRIQTAAGDSTSAITNLTEARDAVISTLGDRSPALAPYDDELAVAERARGSIRRALALHDRSLALQPDNAIALLARARTKLEGGDVLAADHDATQAKALLTKAQKDPAPAFELLADIAQERGVPELAQQLRNSTHPIDPPDDELLTVERARAPR
jgi:tetratricopeptide (TPR) repeat protein